MAFGIQGFQLEGAAHGEPLASRHVGSVLNELSSWYVVHELNMYTIMYYSNVWLKI